jgi:hypothetical protein
MPSLSEREIRWRTPPEWKEQPRSAMRAGSFLYRADNGQQVDISVIPLSGEAGGLLANVNRWRGQIGLPALNPDALTQNVQKIHPGGREMALVDFSSREPRIDERFKMRIVAAIYARGAQTWFLKMAGEEFAVGSAKPAFLDFLGSLHFQTHER